MRKSIAKIAAATAAGITAATLMLAGPAAAAVNDCSHGGGSYGGNTYGELSNGEIHVGECNDPFDGHMWTVRQVNVEYSKYAGSTSHVQFGWQMVSDSSASSVYNTWWSSTTYDISANSTKGTYFAYPNSSPAAFSSSWKCLRGVMRDQTQLVFITKTICKL